MLDEPRMVSSIEAVLARLGEKLPLLDVEQQLVRAVGIRTEEELLSLLRRGLDIRFPWASSHRRRRLCRRSHRPRSRAAPRNRPPPPFQPRRRLTSG